MTIKTAPRARLLSSTSLFPMLRGPQVFYAPDEDGGEPVDDTPEEFREQEGDREPEPEAAAEPEPEAEEDDEGDPEPEAEGDPEPEPEPEDEPEGEPEASAEPPQKKDWRDRQIAKLRERERAKDEELAEAKRRAEAAEALLAATPEEREAGAGDKTKEEIRRQVAEEVRQEEFFKRLNTGLVAMDEAGKKAFAGTWDGRIAAAAELFGEEMRNRPDMLEAITDLPNAAVVYHELAGDLDKLEALIQMPAHKMGMELAKLSQALSKPPAKPVSKVPKPITPLTRSGGERTLEELMNDPNADMAEIDRRMAAEEKKRIKAH